MSFRDFLDNKHLFEGKQAVIFRKGANLNDLIKALEDLDGFSVRGDEYYDFDHPLVATRFFDSDWSIEITKYFNDPNVIVKLFNDRAKVVKNITVKNERDLISAIDEYDEFEMRMNENLEEAEEAYDKFLNSNLRISKYWDLTPNAREINLFIENDEELYRRMIQPIEKNLLTKFKKGEYDSAKAIKAFLNLVNEGLKKYNNTFKDNQIKLSKDEKILCAVNLTKSFEDDCL